MAISTLWSPRPVTRPAHSPSIVARPSSSRPSSRKKSIVPPRSSTTIPTLSIRLSAMCPIYKVSSYRLMSFSSRSASVQRARPHELVDGLQHDVRHIGLGQEDRAFDHQLLHAVGENRTGGVDHPQSLVHLYGRARESHAALLLGAQMHVDEQDVVIVLRAQQGECLCRIGRGL